MDQGLIMAGKIDNRSIHDVTPDELRGYTRVGFFSGIAGWDLALQLAGWPEDKPVWHGSCPCQPFSTAGKGLAQADERHLWPVFFNLIKKCRPEYVFGEQVASAIGKGWLDGVSSDLGEEGYTCGSAVLGAHSVGAPHIRQRLYWVAHTESIRSREGQQDARGSVSGGDEEQRAISVCGSSASGMGNPIMSRCETCDSISGGDESRPEQSQDSSAWSNVGVADTELRGCECQPQQRSSSILPPMDEQRESREPACPHSPSPHRPARPDDHWSNCTIIPCRDGKARRIPAQAIIEPVLQHVVDGFSCSLDARRNILSAAQGFPLTETIPARVILLKGAGNAIVPAVAAEFIQAFQETQAATA
jgi:DNA (cytosine-5)-methyltransferase 1